MRRCVSYVLVLDLGHENMIYFSNTISILPPGFEHNFTSSFFTCSVVYLSILSSNFNFEKQNVTLDDTNLFITYSPSTSWHANTVACSSCLAPDPALAHSGTWHDGTHIVPTTDEDDEGTGGVPDSDGDGNGSSGSTSNSVVAATSSSSSSPSSTQSVTGGNTDNDDDDNGEDDDDSHKGKGGGKNISRQCVNFFIILVNNESKFESLITYRFRRDDENPFEVQSLDSDDPGFQDVPVTASLTFTGTYSISLL